MGKTLQRETPDQRLDNMYALYKKERLNGRDRFRHVEAANLFGCRKGYIPRLLNMQTSASQGEPYKWHVAIQPELCKLPKYQDTTLVIDLKPKQKEKKLSLYELLDVWGYSAHEWTPIMLRLSGLFVDADPRDINRSDFLIEDQEREGPIYEFLYLDGSVAEGKLTGRWTAPPVSPTNAALLWPKTLKYFVDCIKQCTPGLV
jgi:hypothetical protein